MHPHASPEATGSFRAVHRRFRRVRWFLLVGALLLYAIVREIDQRILEHLHIVLDDQIADFGVAMLIAIGVTLAITRWENRWVAEIEAHEVRRMANERALMQLEAAQATARTVAHTINQPLAIIRGVVELYRDTPPTERDDADLATVLAQVDRAAGLVRQLLVVSRYRTIPYPGGAPMLDLSEPP
jgi:signal transduction histidine kinase